MLNSAIVGRVRKRVKIAVAAIGEVWQQQQEAGRPPRNPPAARAPRPSPGPAALLQCRAERLEDRFFA
jgi:hypothetical protein